MRSATDLPSAPEPPAKRPAVAVLGIGRIGSGLVSTLTAAGYRVSAHDLRPEVEAATLSAGAAWCESPHAAVSEAEVVLTVLPGSPELASLMLADRTGLLAALRPSQVWIDLTSASPALGRRLSLTAGEHDISYLDAPIGGGPAAARSGTLTLYLGGPSDIVDEQRPLLRTIASRVHHLGGHGSGYLAKLLVNLLWFGQAAAVGEALLLGQAGGLSPAALQQVLPGSPAASAFTEQYLPGLLEGDYVRDFGLDRVVEELQSLVDLADQHSSPFALSAQVTRLHEQALRRFGTADGELLGIAELEAVAGRTLGHPTG